MMRKLLIQFILLLVSTLSFAQFTDCTSGLIAMPSAEMQEDGTFMITNNYLNKHATPDRWRYDTFNYGFSFTFLQRVEIAYVCTIFNYKWAARANTPERPLMINQDRHFSVRFQIFKEHEFFDWMPSVVLGASDPLSGGTGAEWGNYFDSDVSGTGNGYFNRYYLAMSKHWDTPCGLFYGNLAYQYNRRLDYPLNGPCIAVAWEPVWINGGEKWLSSFRVIAEYDSRTFNIGLVSGILDDHIALMFELQAMKWISAGIRYKIRIK